MLRKCLASLALAGMFTTMSYATGVDLVQVVFVGGGTSTYDATSQTLTWSGGASGTAITTGFSIFNFDQATVSATIDGLTTNPANSSAQFSNMSWSMSLVDTSNPLWTLDVSGTLKAGTTWLEEITAPDFLIGEGLVMVDSFSINLDGGSVAGWEGGANDVAALQSSTTFATGTGPSDFLSDYTTDNTTIVLSADETVIPEPATLSLLGLGALALVKRRRA